MPVVAEAQPEPIETISADGITTIISWKLDEQDRRVKVSLPVSDPILADWDSR